MLSGVLLLGLLAPARAPAPRILLPDAGPGADYVSAVETAIDAARRRVWVMVYVLRHDPALSADQDPVRRLVAALARAQTRGCEVRVLVDRSRVFRSDDEDHKHDGSVDLLLAHGLSPRLDSLARTLHAKAALIDDTVLIGSQNWTVAALLRNVEVGALLHDPAAVAALERLFDLQWSAATPAMVSATAPGLSLP